MFRAHQKIKVRMQPATYLSYIQGRFIHPDHSTADEHAAQLSDDVGTQELPAILLPWYESEIRTEGEPQWPVGDPLVPEVSALAYDPLTSELGYQQLRGWTPQQVDRIYRVKVYRYDLELTALPRVFNHETGEWAPAPGPGTYGVLCKGGAKPATVPLSSAERFSLYGLARAYDLPEFVKAVEALGPEEPAWIRRTTIEEVLAVAYEYSLYSLRARLAGPFYARRAEITEGTTDELGVFLEPLDSLWVIDGRVAV